VGLDVGVGARDLPLHLHQDRVAVREQLLDVRLAHLVHALLRVGRAFGGAPEDGEQLLVGAVAAGEEELALGAEEAEQVRLADAGLAGDRLGRGAVVAADGEMADRDGEDLLAALLGGLAGAGLDGDAV
jgi:hypothetical protein